ncbi:MAG: hypothetical protein J5950_03630 [Clostridia bacterium]|nr:hypothetical protein [Clostridia bacterium]
MKKVYIIILTALVCSFAVCGILAAADWYREDRTTNTVSVGNLSAEIVDIYEQDTVVMPGDTIDKIVSVKNTGESDEIVRVRIEGEWTDSFEPADPEQLSCETNGDDWIFDAGSGYYYYTDVLSPGEVSEPLMRSFSLSGPNVNNVFSGRPGRITIVMEAVQAAAGGVRIWGKTNDELSIKYDERPEHGDDSESGVTFRGSESGFDFGDNSDLFSSFKNLLPGQTVIQNISVGNSNVQSTEIFLKAECGDRGNDELLLRLLTGYTEIEVKANGKTVYKGPVWRDGAVPELRAAEDGGQDGRALALEELYGGGISLGSIAADSDTQITVELKLSPEAGNEFQDLAGDVDWIFCARGGNEPIPQTGDNELSIYFVYMIAAGAAVILLMLIRLLASGKGGGNESLSGGAVRAGKIRKTWIIPVIAAVSAALAAVVIFTVSGTFAFMTDKESAENEISPGSLSIELTEPGYEPGHVLDPGAAVSKDPTVTNTGTVPMLAYIRVRIPIKNVATVDGATKMIIPAAERELFSFTPDGSWTMIEKVIAASNDGSKHADYVFGYELKALDPGEDSVPLFEEIRFINILEGELEYGAEIDVDVSAFGLQNAHIAEGQTMAERLSHGYYTIVKGAWT